MCAEKDLDDVVPAQITTAVPSSEVSLKPVTTKKSDPTSQSQDVSGPMNFEEAMRKAREAVARGEMLSVEPPVVVTTNKPKKNVVTDERSLSMKEKKQDVASKIEPRPSHVLPDVKSLKTEEKQKDLPVPTVDKAELAEKAVVAPIAKPKDAASDFFALLGQVKTPDVDLVKATTTKPDMVEAIALDEAVSLMLRNNFEVKASAYGLDSKKWDRIGAYSQYLPSVELTYAEGAERSSVVSHAKLYN